MSEKEKVEPITQEEIETPVEKLVAKRAEELYKKETGKEWKEQPPSEAEGAHYVRLAGREILGRWLKAAKEYHAITETIFGAPAERKMMLVKVGKRVEMLPTEEALKPSKLPATAVIQCPYCGKLSMTQLVSGIWQCKNCYRTVNTLAWFPRRKLK